MKAKRNGINPGNWGLSVDPLGELKIQGFRVSSLADIYGTPLHVVNETRLYNTACEFMSEMKSAFKGKTSVHYAFKCNPVPAVINILRTSGLKAEVMTEFEFELAKRSGYSGNDIIVNGPCKSTQLLTRAVKEKVRFIVIDSFEELPLLQKVAAGRADRPVDILLRINLNYIPKGIIKAAAATSSRSSAFGLDLKSGEVFRSIRKMCNYPSLNFCGFHFHIGSGIQDPKDYSRAIEKLKPVIEFCRDQKIKIRYLDVGGGYGISTTREFGSKDLFLYHVLNILPEGSNCSLSLKDFGKEISDAIMKIFPEEELPEVIFEPGRCITSSNQFLLIKAYRVKARSGGRRFLITDGGLGTVALPVFYEYHEIILCNDVYRLRNKFTTITGPCCFSSDVIYRNKLISTVYPGEILAVMDSGAYFTQLESSFGYPHPAIVFVNCDLHRLVRSRESIEDYLIRDCICNGKVKGVQNEIFSH